MSVNCCGHDALDWVAALGPTIATLAAAGVAWAVYRSDARARRELTRPMLVFKESLEPTGVSMRWRLELRNHGQSLADIVEFTIMIDGKKIIPGRLQAPILFWQVTLQALGYASVTSITGNLIFAPFSVGAGIEHLIFDVQLTGPEQAMRDTLIKLNINLLYKSPLGEQFTTSLRQIGPLDTTQQFKK